MEGRQILEAIFTSSASPDRLPSAALRKLLGTLHTLPFVCTSSQPGGMTDAPPAQTIWYSFRVGNRGELSMMELKMTSNSFFFFHQFHRVSKICFAIKKKEQKRKKKSNRDLLFLASVAINVFLRNVILHIVLDLRHLNSRKT